MEDRLSAFEFGEWWALYRHEPWGEVRGDLAAGQVAAVMANIHRKETAKPFSALDFCPYLKPREETKEVDPAEFMKAISKHG